MTTFLIRLIGISISHVSCLFHFVLLALKLVAVLLIDNDMSFTLRDRSAVDSSLAVDKSGTSGYPHTILGLNR